jgi:hypothetical protein
LSFFVVEMMATGILPRLFLSASPAHDKHIEQHTSFNETIVDSDYSLLLPHALL